MITQAIEEVHQMMEQGISLERAVDIAYSRLIRKGIYNIGKAAIREGVEKCFG